MKVNGQKPLLRWIIKISVCAMRMLAPILKIAVWITSSQMEVWVDLASDVNVAKIYVNLISAWWLSDDVVYKKNVYGKQQRYELVA